MKWLIGAISLIVAMFAISFILGRGRSSAVNVLGSTSIQPFAGMLAQEFNKMHPDCLVDVQGGGSTAGLEAADTGIADIGTCSRALTPEEEKVFTPIVIARDGLAIVVHPSNPVDNLSRERIRRMFTGEITEWSQIPGYESFKRPIQLITREEGSGTREAFMKLIMGQERVSRRALNQESNGAVKELVKHDPCAIGYMSLGLVQGELKMVRVDGRTPSAAAVKNETYPLVRPFLFVTKGPPDEQAKRFIDFVLSGPSQKTLEEEGLISAK